MVSKEKDGPTRSSPGHSGNISELKEVNFQEKVKFNLVFLSQRACRWS